METCIQYEISGSQKQKKIDPNVDIYILTYGHFQSRIHQIDPIRDIVIFDEFHKMSGEMILAMNVYKGPILLLSATPVNMPELKGTPFKIPGIPRRFPTNIIEVDDMNVVDMVMLGMNAFPEKMDRALIIVPDKTEVRRVMNNLHWLNITDATELHSGQRKVPRTGCIVATPYVEIGLDIKPPAKILFDCGKTIVIEKGVFQYPYPWTDPDTNKQRAGRVARLEPGVVYRPKSAGSGRKPVVYPSGYMFMHNSVAEHFRVAPLKPIKGAKTINLPFLSLNTEVLNTEDIRKSVLAIHLLVLSGVRLKDVKGFYCRLQQGFDLGEDYWWSMSVLKTTHFKYGEYIDWDQCMFHCNNRNAVCYNIDGEHKFSRPIVPINGKWMDCFDELYLNMRPSDQIVPTRDEWESSYAGKYARLHEKTRRLKEATNRLISKIDGSIDIPELIRVRNLAITYDVG